MSQFEYTPEIWARLPRAVKASSWVYDLTFEDVSAYFEAKNARAECPQCSTNGWEFMPPSQRGLAYLVFAREFEQDKEKVSIPTFAMTCVNCGFIRTHAALLVAHWKLDNNDVPPPPTLG